MVPNEIGAAIKGPMNGMKRATSSVPAATTTAVGNALRKFMRPSLVTKLLMWPQTKITSQSIPHVNDEELIQCKQQFAKGGLKALDLFLQNKAEEWKKVPLDVAIIGRSGVGKSSFINAIRGVTSKDDHFAKVASYKQCTMEPHPYPHPKNPLLIFWDLPGVGTKEFNKKNYLQKIDFGKYDFFLILAKERFTDDEIWLAEVITREKKQFFFVRTHIDEDITKNKKNYPENHREETVLVEVRDDIKDNLGDLYREEGIFLINNNNRLMYDFERLDLRLMEEYPDRKREAYILSSSVVSERIVKKKAEILRYNIWEGSLASGLVAAAPVPGVSIAAIRGY